jgi:hypothetical protein
MLYAWASWSLDAQSLTLEQLIHAVFAKLVIVDVTSGNSE